MTNLDMLMWQHKLVKKSWDNASIVFLHCFTMLKSIGYKFLNVLKGILYSLDLLQTYSNVKLKYYNFFCINTRHIFNINLIYETCKHIYIVPKGGIYDFVITNFNHICLNLHDYLINSNSSLMSSHHNHDHSHLCHHSSHLCYAMDDHDLERSCEHGCWIFIILNQIIIMENASND